MSHPFGDATTLASGAIAAADGELFTGAARLIRRHIGRTAQ
jgi:hypothetical protein